MLDSTLSATSWRPIKPVSRLLEIERDHLAERELGRTRTLVEREAVAASRLDEQETQTLSFRKVVQELQNQLNAMPSERKRLEAEIEQNQSRLTRANRDLGYTTVTAPFDFRVAEVSVEQGSVRGRRSRHAVGRRY